MNALTCQHLKTLLAAAESAVAARADEFSALDAAIGDGDHGAAIQRALAAARQAAEQADSLPALLQEAAFAAMSQSCGSTSTLIGAWLLGMSGGVQAEELDAAQTAAMFAAGLANVRQQTRAQPGDKTMLDALIPATEAMQSTAAEGLPAMFTAAAAAAARGAAGTAELVARFGRARNLGERTVGYVDPGAASTACIFDALARSSHTP